MSLPTIAAITPVFNRPTVVIEALESVASQSLPPARLVVIDDGSTDETAARVEAWLDGRRPPFDVKLIRQSNRGAAAARNRGAAEAGDVELLAFLDSDDLWPRDYLQRMARAFSSADTVAATCDIVQVDSDTGAQVSRGYTWAEGLITAQILATGIVGTPSTVIRAAAYRDIGGQNESMKTLEDRHLFLRLSTRGNWRHVPGEPVTVRKRHSASRGEAGHLGETFADPYRQLAQMTERFLFEEGGAAAVSEPDYRKALAAWWYKAGRQLARLRRRAEAHICFRRSLHWRRLQPKAWWHSLLTRWAR